MGLFAALDELNEGNPVARWIRSRLPLGYVNRWVFWVTLVLMLWVMSSYLKAQEPRVLCTAPWGCIHPFTGELLPYGFEQGRALALQGYDLALIFASVLFIGLLINHAVYIWRRG